MSISNSKKILTRRYILFFISVFINAYGICFITKAMLGTSPITSVNYVLSMFTPLTMGQWTIIVNLLFMVLELFFMTRDQLKSDLRVFLLQIPITLCFGTFIDISMASLSWLNPVGYVQQAASVLAGCVILALGIALEVKADVAMVAGEFFVRAIARRMHGDFGYVKLGFDITNVAVACAFSLVFLSGIKGVGLGTVAAALLVGPIVHALTPMCRMLDGGCDPRYIARRLIRMAVEDISLADPRAMQVALDAADIYERLGSPEGELALAQAVVYLAVAAKSNAVYKAFNSVRAFIREDGTRPVPMYLRNAPTKLMDELGYGDGYRYAHDEAGAFAAGEVYLPEGLEGMRWYEPTDRGLEIKIGEKLARLRELNEQAAKQGKARKR